MAEQATQQAQQPAVTTMEAGFSMNVKMLDGSGQEVMLTFRCPQASQAEKLIEHYNNMVGKLLNAGWQPLKAAVRAPQESAPATAGDVPTCPVHGSQMRPGQRGGFFCPKKLADGSYCKAKA